MLVKKIFVKTAVYDSARSVTPPPAGFWSQGFPEREQQWVRFFRAIS